MTQEFLLWSNCQNNCSFCWQKKKKNPETILTESEMLNSIALTKERVLKINNNDDVLLVGGEILFSYYDSVNKALFDLFNVCINKIKKDEIRFLYINTNLIFRDAINIDNLLSLFVDIENRLKFTTSFDLYGRFINKYDKDLFFGNLEYIKHNYPKISIVVNSIITKQLIESNYDWNNLKEKFGIKYINFIPYIPVIDDESMNVTFKDIVKILSYCEKQNPGYINNYIDDFDLNQDKILFEYQKNNGFVECTAKYSDCGHNINFKRILNNGECYICKLKDIFR